MTYKEILKSIRAKEYKPIYFLHGTESYYIEQISRYIENKVLSAAERSFNQIIFYGKDAEAKSIIDAACRYPMMSTHQVIVLKEAQEMKTLAALLPYIEKPVASTVFVICHKHKKLDMRTNFAKSLKKNAFIFESKPLYDNQVPAWIVSYLKDKKLDVNSNAAGMMAEYLGTDLSKISNELDKLVINIPPGTTITEKEVETNIGISKDYNVFELQKALGQRNIVNANRIINYFIANPRKNPLVMVVGALFNYFNKIYMVHFLKGASEKTMMDTLGVRSAYFLKDYKSAARNFNHTQVKQVIGILKDYDLKSKGVNNDGTDPGQLMREMVWKILHY